MLLKIIQAGDEKLRLRSKNILLSDMVSLQTQNLIDLMIATLRDKPGVGLAAPQVGENLRIIVIEDKKAYHKSVDKKLLQAQKRVPVPLQVIINPTIEIQAGVKKYFFEGCLSVEGYRAVVSRFEKVTVNGYDRQGKELQIHADGWLARILQHELEHLDGSLYIDTMHPASFMSEANFVKNWSSAQSEKIKKLLATSSMNHGTEVNR